MKPHWLSTRLTATLFCLTTSMWSAPAFAQSQTVPAVPTGPLPTDVTPIRLREEREMFRPGPSLYLYQKLPANLWFNTSTETNLRYESNVFLTAQQPKRDLVYRIFPNLTVGYNFLKNTGIYTNYFMIKDVYADTAPGTSRLNLPTTQSISLGIRHNRQIRSTNFQLDVQARELFQSKNLHQFDYLPGFLLSRAITQKMFGFVNIQLQLRGGQPFIAPTREIDPFFTVGVLRSLGPWTFSATTTFIRDFRNPPFHTSIPQQGNAEMISDFELYRPIMKKHPSLVGFIRAEPIWNWASKREAGLSGFDFRLYSGIRLAFAKPAVGSIMNQMRDGIKPKKEEKTPELTPTAPGAPQPVPNSALPSPDATANSTTAVEQTVAASIIKPVIKTSKPSMFDRFKDFALGPANVGGNQPQMTLIPNSMNPLGPMIPVFTAPTPPQVALRAKMDTSLVNQRQTTAPSQNPALAGIPEDASEPAVEHDVTVQPQTKTKAQMFTSDLHLNTAFDSSSNRLKTKSLLPIADPVTLTN